MFAYHVDGAGGDDERATTAGDGATFVAAGAGVGASSFPIAEINGDTNHVYSDRRLRIVARLGQAGADEAYRNGKLLLRERLWHSEALRSRNQPARIPSYR